MQTQKAYRLISFAYIVLLAGILISLLLKVPKLILGEPILQNAENGLSDYCKFYLCGKIVLSGLGQHAYDAQTQLAMASKVFFPLQTNMPWIQYVPFIYLAMVPFALLPIGLSHLVWSFLSFAFAILALTVLLRRIANFTYKQIALFLVGFAASMPVWFAIYTGQSNLWLTGFVAFYCLFFLKGKDLAGGIALALTSVKPQFSIFLAVPALAEKRWWLLLTAFITECVLMSASAFVLGWQNIFDYPRFLLSTEAHQDVASNLMITARGILSQLAPQSITLFASFILLFVAFLFIYIFWKEKAANWRLAIVIVLSLLVSPHGFFYDCTLLAVAAALTLPSVSILECYLLKSPSMRVWSLVMIFYPLISIFIPALPQGLQQMSVFLINLLLIICGCLYVTGLKSESSDSKGKL
jgi:hypothetical protein